MFLKWNAGCSLSPLFSEIKLYFLKDERRFNWLLTSYFLYKIPSFCWLKLSYKVTVTLVETWPKWCLGIELLDMFLSSVGLLEGCRLLYCHVGLGIGAFDVGISSSGKLCHFLFLVHYLTSFAVLGGTFSRCMQRIRENN